MVLFIQDHFLNRDVKILRQYYRYRKDLCLGWDQILSIVSFIKLVHSFGVKVFGNYHLLLIKSTHSLTLMIPRDFESKFKTPADNSDF